MKVAAALASLMVCACASSPPVHFYVLDPLSSGGPGAGPGSADFTIQVASVHVPQTLDRREIVREDAPNNLTISDRSRWGAPLGDMTQRVLSEDLMLRLPAGRVVLPRQPAPAGTNSISVEILEFGAVATGDVVLDGSWSIVPSDTQAAVASYRFQLSQHARSGDYADQARIMSILLGQLADSIAHQLAARS